MKTVNQPDSYRVLGRYREIMCNLIVLNDCIFNTNNSKFDWFQSFETNKQTKQK